MTIIRRGDPEYPPALAQIFDPPAALYMRGTLVPQDAVAVAIVGTRRPTEYGLRVAARLAADLAVSGVTVVSGLARGIDGAAHQGALDAGGRTIAVLGCGPDLVYPPEHRRLMDGIIGHGAVVSEFPPGTPPRKPQFPQRNRIISGLSLGVVVVEGDDTSGALITADAALEQGREVFAVPGRITDRTSRAPHRLLAEGAKLVMQVEDVLEELLLPSLPYRPAAAPPVLDGDEAAVFAVLRDEPQHLDRLAAMCAMPVMRVSRALVVLECRGLITALPGARYMRRDARPQKGPWSEQNHTAG